MKKKKNKKKCEKDEMVKEEIKENKLEGCGSTY